MPEHTKVACPDCGPTQVPHAIEKWSIIMGWFWGPYNRFVDAVWRWAEPIFVSMGGSRLGIPIFRLFELFHIGKIANEPSEKDSMRAVRFWQEAKKRGIDMKELYVMGRPTELFVAKYKDWVRIFTGLPRPDGAPSKGLSWMDDKGIMKQKFIPAGIPVAKGGVAFLFSTAKKIWKDVSAPVITKPNLGSRSRHTIIHINTEPDLRHGFNVAKVLSPWVIVEQELTGSVHRATVIGGKVAGVLRRDPPQIIGDGKHTVRELFDIENKNPLRNGEVFHKIEDGPDADAELKRQGLTWDNLPASGRFVPLNQKVGRSSGASNADVTDETHIDNIRVFENVAQTLGNEPLVGIDYIIADISKSWKEQLGSGVIECNSMPFIDLHHAPMTGKVRNTAGALWDIVLPASRS